MPQILAEAADIATHITDLSRPDTEVPPPPCQDGKLLRLRLFT
jgi:hypothetical protein